MPKSADLDILGLATAPGGENMRGRINRRPALAASLGGVRAAIGGLVAICCILAPAEVHAKHAALGPGPDDQAPAADAPAAADKSGQSTVITGEFVETHDRLTPEVYRGIERVHTFQISLSGKNQIHETWTLGRADAGGALMNRQGKVRGRFGFKVRQGEQSVTIGESGSHVVWHILGEKKLQRIFAGEHLLMMLEIEIGPDNACRASARYLQQTGFEFVVMRRGDNGELANFSLPHVERASCAIQ